MGDNEQVIFWLFHLNVSGLSISAFLVCFVVVVLLCFLDM